MFVGRMIILLLTFFLFSAVVPRAFTQEVSLTLSPRVINVGLDFKGTTLDVSGTAPAECDIYLKIVSLPQKEKVTKKGKRFFLWLDVAQVEIKNAPKIYQVYTSADISRLPPELQKEIGVDKDFGAVRTGMEVIETTNRGTKKLTGQEEKEYADSLINAYKRKNLYVLQERLVNTKVEEEKKKFSVAIALPADIPLGNTTITAYAVKDGRLVGKSINNLTVQPVGIVSWAWKMARMYGPIYGIFDIFVALFVGALVGVLFICIEGVILSFAKRKKAGQGQKVDHRGNMS